MHTQYPTRTARSQNLQQNEQANMSTSPGTYQLRSASGTENREVNEISCVSVFVAISSGEIVN